jgi:cellulose synthase/poly-beta-1,6-N-acetylglucosamine synthase-like glycosyltransferase
MPPSQKRITVGIPSFNEEFNISRLLHSIIELNKLGSNELDNQNNSEYRNDDSLAAETRREKTVEITEVIISDDSSDDTCRIVDEIAAQNPSLNVKLIHHDCRRGVSAAWNEIFGSATGDVIVLYDADIIIEKNTTAFLVGSIREDIGLCASNSKPLVSKKSTITRASMFIADWLGAVRKYGLSQYTVMGRALSISSDVAKKITIPENVIALDLYLQCKVLEQGMGVHYNENAVIYFKPPDNMFDFSSQIIRAMNGHKQIEYLMRSSCSRLPFRSGLVTTLKSVAKDPKGALSLVSCYAVLPYYSQKLSGADSSKWHIAKSTKTPVFA